MKQEAVSIYNFKKGDIITRISPSKPIPGLEAEDFRDRAYIGVPLKFLGVANGCIYVERESANKDLEEIPEIGRLFKAMMGGETGPINLPLDMWSEGWANYIDPYEIDNNKDKKIAGEILEGANKIQLKKELKEALAEENYELAENIKKRLKKFE